MDITVKRDLSLRIKSKRGIFTTRFLIAFLIAILLHGLAFFLFRIDLFNLRSGKSPLPYTQVVSEWENPGGLLASSTKTPSKPSYLLERPLKKPPLIIPKLNMPVPAAETSTDFLHSTLLVDHRKSAVPLPPYREGKIRYIGISPLTPPTVIEFTSPPLDLPIVYSVIVDKKRGRVFWYSKEQGSQKLAKEMESVIKNLKFAIEEDRGFIKGKIELKP